MNKIIKKCINILLIVTFLLQQTGCATMWASRSYNPPTIAYYQYHANKLVSAYVDKSESYLTICIEGTLNISNKSPISQIFALYIPIIEEKLKTPSKGIQYSVYNNKIPTVEIDHSATLSECPELPEGARTVTVENKDTLKYNKEEARKLHLNLDQATIRNIPHLNPNEPDTVYFTPLQQYTDDKLVKELVYVARPSMTLSTPPLVTHVNTPDGIEKLQNPVALQEPMLISSFPFSGQQFLILKTKGEEKSIPNNNFEYYALLPFAVTVDILASPIYLVGGIIFISFCILSSGRCLRMG